MADSISKGTSIEEANTKYLESQNSTSVGEFTASVINGGNTDYPEGVLRSGCGDEKWRREGDHAFHLHLCGAEAGCFGREGQLFHAITAQMCFKAEGEDFQKLLQERKDSFEVEEKGGVLRRCEKLWMKSGH